MPKNKGQNISLQAVKITRLIKISRDGFVLSFPRTFDFKAGQVIAIGLNKDDDPRVYSIASGTEDPDIDILFNVNPEGHLTPQLAKMKPGDKIWISHAFGSFLGGPEPAIWIGAGTGIAPYRSMMRSGFMKDKILVHGSRFLDSFYFEDEFSEVMGNDFIHCCSQERAPGYFSGRVTAYLESLPEPPTDMAYYLCGSVEMVIACREILLMKGVPFMKIFSEVYF